MIERVNKVKVSVGTSMLPSIFPEAKLRLSLVKPVSVRAGDILCYPCDGGTIAAHRVLRIERDGQQTVFVMRGDAQKRTERIPATAIASRVRRVEQSLLSYDVSGLVGRLFSQLALHDETIWRVARLGAVRGSSLGFRIWRKLFR